MGWIFPVDYRCRIDRNNEQSVFRAIRTGSAETVAMAPILSTVRHFSNHVTSLADTRLLIGKAVGGTSAFASQAGRPEYGTHRAHTLCPFVVTTSQRV